MVNRVTRHVVLNSQCNNLHRMNLHSLWIVAWNAVEDCCVTPFTILPLDDEHVICHALWYLWMMLWSVSTDICCWMSLCFQLLCECVRVHARVCLCLSHNMSRSECHLLFICELYTHHYPQHRNVSSWTTNNLLSRMMEQKLLPCSGCMHMKWES